MSSPKMTRMFGFRCGVWAITDVPRANVAIAVKIAPASFFPLIVISPGSKSLS